jgi:predicted transposase/invertase (TIGR01784 family)
VVTKLEYTFKNDTLFKMVFVKFPNLLKRLVSIILAIRFENIEEFIITNPEMPPDVIGDKFCRLDILMKVDGQQVDLEIQVSNEGDYPERSLYYWARAYSSALGEGEEYRRLPRTIIISIVAFNLFDCAGFHSVFQVLEVKRFAALTDKLCLHYLELMKLPEVNDAEDELKLWLTLFNAETEEELAKIEKMGVPVMNQAIGAYRQVVATEEFKEIERLRSRARHNEASALGNARREGIAIGAETERVKWQTVVADKEVALADKDAALADKDAEITRLRAQLKKQNGN